MRARDVYENIMCRNRLRSSSVSLNLLRDITVRSIDVLCQYSKLTNNRAELSSRRKKYITTLLGIF